jgi:hypothetical protein
MQNRAASMPHKQVADSIEFQLMRTKLRVLDQSPNTAVTEFTDDVRDKRYADSTAAQYGLTLALLQATKIRCGRSRLPKAQAKRPTQPDYRQPRRPHQAECRRYQRRIAALSRSA